VPSGPPAAAHTCACQAGLDPQAGARSIQPLLRLHQHLLLLLLLLCLLVLARLRQLCLQQRPQVCWHNNLRGFLLPLLLLWWACAGAVG
jgi:hypothetical protein